MKKGMKAREFLNRAAKAERKVDAALQKVELCRSLTQRVTSTINGEQVSRTRNVTANEDAIIRLTEAKEQARALTEEYMAIVADTIKVVS